MGSPYVSYSGCGGHRAGSCPSNRTITWSDAAQGGPVYASQVEELRVAIINEVSRWKQHRFYVNIPITQTTAITAGQQVAASTFNNLNAMVAGIYGATGAVAPAGLVDDANWDALIANYNVARQNCICNSDCTCNTICSCYGDCGCNYSDERLKTDITLVDTIDGINVYTWKYVWDSSKRFIGVIAQELIGTRFETALTQDKNGFYMVDYSNLPVKHAAI